MKKDIVRSITFNAVVAAIYFVLALITSPFAFLGAQVRIAEALVSLGEFSAVSLIGYWLFFLLGKQSEFLRLINANHNQNFIFYL